MPSDYAMRRQPAEMLQLLREKNPLVQCMQTPVSMDITANVLLAVGAAPAMVCSEDETPAFLPKADVLYVNMGTLTAARVSEVGVAVAEAARLQKPWVLDPVACGGTPHRTEHCAEVMKQRPTIVRGNGSEIIALAAAACSTPPAPPSGAGPRGADSTAKSSAAIPAAHALAQEFGSVIVISGAVDIIADASGSCVQVEGGSPLLTKITGVGCALSALVAAFLAVDPDTPVDAAAAACATMSSASEGCACHDPGNLRVHVMARLHAMTPLQLCQAARIAGIEQADAGAVRASGDGSSGDAAALSMQLLEEGARAHTAQVIFHPVALLVALDACPSATYSQLDSALAALIAVASSAGPTSAGSGTDARGAAASFARLMLAAQASGGGGGLMAAAVLRTFLAMGEAVRRAQQSEGGAGSAGSAGGGIWAPARVAAVEKALALVQGDLERRKVLAAMGAAAAGAAEARAYYDGGIDAVVSVLEEIDAGCGGKGSMQMMVPADWARARKLLGEALQCQPPVLHPRAPRVLIVAGSDSSGGAGIQADIKACQAMGAFAMTAISALTAQNTQGVQGVMGVPCAFLEQQILSCLSDIRADVIKTGMLATPEVVECVVRAVGRHGMVKWVVDPVMVATSGHELVDSAAVAAIKKHLFPVAHIITPNLPEAALLLKKPVESKVEAMVEAAKALAGMGPQWVLVKGGHMDGGMCSDVLLESKTGNVTVIEGLHLATNNTHGTGCTLASSIAALLAQGLSTVEAVTRAKHYVWDAIRFSAGLGLGAGHGPLNHQYATAHWTSPWCDRSLCRGDKPVHRGKPVDYALYAVTDDAMIAAQGLSLPAAVDAAIRGGVTVVQLRQKDVDSSVMLKAANQLMAVCRPRGVPLIVNDRVDIALACDADGVHVGQDDLPCDVVRRMLGPHKIVGVSVKTRQEVAQAERDGADYVGSGAVYPTSTKDSSAIGVEGIALVCSGTCLPVVAIGGVNGANCGDSIAAGASGIAVVSAIFNKPDPKTAAQVLAAAVNGALAQHKAA